MYRFCEWQKINTFLILFQHFRLRTVQRLGVSALIIKTVLLHARVQYCSETMTARQEFQLIHGVSKTMCPRLCQITSIVDVVSNSPSLQCTSYCSPSRWLIQSQGSAAQKAEAINLPFSLLQPSPCCGMPRGKDFYTTGISVLLYIQY